MKNFVILTIFLIFSVLLFARVFFEQQHLEKYESIELVRDPYWLPSDATGPVALKMESSIAAAARHGLPPWALVLIFLFYPILWWGLAIPYYVRLLIPQIMAFGVAIALSSGGFRWLFWYLFLGTIAVYILQINFQVLPS